VIAKIFFYPWIVVPGLPRPPPATAIGPSKHSTAVAHVNIHVNVGSWFFLDQFIETVLKYHVSSMINETNSFTSLAALCSRQVMTELYFTHSCVIKMLREWAETHVNHAPVFVSRPMTARFRRDDMTSCANHWLKHVSSSTGLDSPEELLSATILFMAALCNIGQAIIFALWFLSSSFFFFFPRLISAVGEWMSTILPHLVWP